MQEGFMMDAQTACFFFRVCRRYHVEGREDRIALIREITRRGKAKYIRNVAPLLEDKRVVETKPKRKDNETN